MNATNNSSSFARLAAINVNDHVEKKQGLSYLPWAWAVDQLLGLTQLQPGNTAIATEHRT